MFVHPRIRPLYSGRCRTLPMERGTGPWLSLGVLPASASAGGKYRLKPASRVAPKRPDREPSLFLFRLYEEAVRDLTHPATETDAYERLLRGCDSRLRPHCARAPSMKTPSTCFVLAASSEALEHRSRPGRFIAKKDVQALSQTTPQSGDCLCARARHTLPY